MSNPTVLNVSNSSDNAYVTVTFSEDVFTNSNGTGELTINDFSVTITGGNATLHSIESISKTSNSIYVLKLLFSGAPNGNETAYIDTASDTSIYNSSGNPMLQIGLSSKVYPPTTLTTTINTTSELSGTISGQSYGDGTYTITSDVDNSSVTTGATKQYPPADAFDNFVYGDNISNTFWEGTTTGHTHGNGYYTINISTHSLTSYSQTNTTGYAYANSRNPIDTLYTDSLDVIMLGAGGSPNTAAVYLTFSFPEKFVCSSITTRFNHSATQIHVNVYERTGTGFLIDSNTIHRGKIYESQSVPNVSSQTEYTTLTMDHQIEGDIIEVRLQSGTKQFYQNNLVNPFEHLDLRFLEQAEMHLYVGY